MLERRRCLTGLLLVFFLFILACTEELPSPTENQSDDSTIIANDEAELVNENGTLPSGACNASWVCISSSYKMYRDENCEFSQKTECELGCENGECQKPATCTAGFKCKNDNEKGYQQEDCSWIQRTKCDFGCNEGMCLNASSVENAENESESETPSAATPATDQTILKVGEKVTVQDEELSIYLLEADRVRLKLGDQKTDWLTDGQSYKFSSGTVVTVKEILFQAYIGGKKEIVYEVD